VSIICTNTKNPLSSPTSQYLGIIFLIEILARRIISWFSTNYQKFLLKSSLYSSTKTILIFISLTTNSLNLNNNEMRTMNRMKGKKINSKFQIFLAHVLLVITGDIVDFHYLVDNSVLWFFFSFVWLNEEDHAYVINILVGYLQWICVYFYSCFHYNISRNLLITSICPICSQCVFHQIVLKVNGFKNK
jgi:hypothetical protein